MKKIELASEEIQKIIKMYKEDQFSMARIGELCNPPISKTVIRRILKENNIPLNIDKHKYKADYRKFKNIDSAEKAYWLGFIAADGCVYKREQNATIRIQLSRVDKEHLERFVQFMEANVIVQDVEQTTGYATKDNPSLMSVVAFNSIDMAKDLIALDVKPKKSYNLSKPNIPEEFYLPYILGYFDGDGSLFKLSNGEYVINITGTKNCIKWINEILQMSNRLEKRQPDKETYHIRCGGINKPYQIMKKLYESCPKIHLDRKFEIYKELETVVLNRNIQ